MCRNRWVDGRRTRGEDYRPKITSTKSNDPLPDNTNGIWYLNPNGQATGDIRAYAVLGLYCNTVDPTLQVGMIIDSSMSPFMQAFLRDCHVKVIHNNGNLRMARRYTKKNDIFHVNQSQYSSFDKPGNMFQFQRDILNCGSSTVPQRVRELRDLTRVVPAIRSSLGITNGVSKDTLIVHVKKKAYIKNTLNGQRNPGVNYHEEHKLGYSLCLALAKIASLAGWEVYINDDEDRIGTSGLSRSIRALDKTRDLLIATGYSSETVRRMMAAPIKRLERANKSMREQYTDVGRYGTSNVRHVGGRSGHLEFMIYMGQKVYYCEEPGAQGESRIADTLCTFRLNGVPLMNRCIIFPTTAGGRAEMEYRYSAPPKKNRPQQDGALVEPRKRISVGENGESVDPFKVEALMKLVEQLGLTAPQPK